MLRLCSILGAASVTCAALRDDAQEAQFAMDLTDMNFNTVSNPAHPVSGPKPYDHAKINARLESFTQRRASLHGLDVSEEQVALIHGRNAFQRDQSSRQRVEAAEAHELSSKDVSLQQKMDRHTNETSQVQEEPETSGKDAFVKAEEDSAKVKEDVSKVESATHDAQEKSKEVDKDFKDQEEKNKKLDDALDVLSQKSFRWQQETMQFLADAEGDKYSPLMSVKLDHSRANMTQPALPTSGNSQNASTPALSPAGGPTQGESPNASATAASG
mmetsp:Transcript_60673/g.113365  ORF Transcript_60673/g.113365 Transcript_60673/m.113365 type:complete len:272 (+) Transcript_60673:121-936(+)